MENQYIIFNIYKEIIIKKIAYVNENINLIKRKNIGNNELQNLNFKTISNILRIFLGQIQLGKYLLILYALIINIIDKKNNDIFEPFPQILNLIREILK